jgi:LPXTG-motif cell wall-anchored protein
LTNEDDSSIESNILYAGLPQTGEGGGLLFLLIGLGCIGSGGVAYLYFKK